MHRNYEHVVDVPAWDYMIRILQAIIALASILLTGYAVVFNNYASVRLSVFTSAWDIAILGYYLVAVHGLPFIYNWVAVLVTETLIVAFWAASFASLAVLYTDHKYAGLLYENVIIAIVALSAFAFVLHFVTMIMIVNGIHKHRKQGKPLFSAQNQKPRAPEAVDTQEV